MSGGRTVVAAGEAFAAQASADAARKRFIEMTFPDAGARSPDAEPRAVTLSGWVGSTTRMLCDSAGSLKPARCGVVLADPGLTMPRCGSGRRAACRDVDDLAPGGGLDEARYNRPSA